MKITADQIHFSWISGEAREKMPSKSSLGFKEGYEDFLEYFYIGCLAQDLQNLRKDQSTFIDLSEVFKFILQEIQDLRTSIPLKVEASEYWAGYFHAQTTTRQLFELAYSSQIEVA